MTSYQIFSSIFPHSKPKIDWNWERSCKKVHECYTAKNLARSNLKQMQRNGKVCQVLHIQILETTDKDNTSQPDCHINMFTDSGRKLNLLKNISAIQQSSRTMQNKTSTHETTHPYLECGSRVYVNMHITNFPVFDSLIRNIHTTLRRPQFSSILSYSNFKTLTSTKVWLIW